MVWIVIKWGLYVILLLSALIFFIADGSEKNTLNLTNSISNEYRNPFYDIPQTSNSPESNSVYKPCFIFALGIVKKTLWKTISPDGAKNQPENVTQIGGIPTYEEDSNKTGKIKLVYPIIAGSQISILAKNDNNSSGSLNPGKSWTSTATNIDVIAYDQKSLRNKSMNTSNFSIIQPVSPPFEYYSSNSSYSGNSSYYVGADGHVITLVNNESAVEPNYEQLIEFIREDKTNEIPYNNSSFVCSDAAERVHNNAETFGFRSAWVYINFENESAVLNQETNALVVGHACNLFNTTDKGLVAIDCTGGSYPSDMSIVDLSEWDNEVSLVNNAEYIPKLLYSFPGSDKLKDFSSMGKITDYYVFW